MGSLPTRRRKQRANLPYRWPLRTGVIFLVSCGIVKRTLSLSAYRYTGLEAVFAGVTRDSVCRIYKYGLQFGMNDESTMKSMVADGNLEVIFVVFMVIRGDLLFLS